MKLRSWVIQASCPGVRSSAEGYNTEKGLRPGSVIDPRSSSSTASRSGRSIFSR